MKNIMKNNISRYIVWFLVLVIIISGYLSWKKKTEYFTADSEYTIEEIPNFLSQ
jgi:hypothetical protein